MSRASVFVAKVFARAFMAERHLRTSHALQRSLRQANGRRLRVEPLEQRALLSVSATLLDAAVSVASARDGQTISVDYEIASGVATSVALECVLLGSDGIAVRDAAHAISVDVAAGTGWYSRQFAINLPPGATAGAYDVTWTVDVEGPDDSSLTAPAALTIEPPVEVRVAVLCYHNVLETSGDFYTTSTADFLAQMRALKAYGYTTVSTQDVLDYRAGIKAPPEKPIMITFDDGFESLATTVLPILADPAIDFKATSFICTSVVRPEEDPGGYPTAPLSWSQIRDLEASGRMDIQSHTVQHADLTALDAAAMVADLADSKSAIETEIGGGKRVTALAYPYGVYSPSVEMAMWEAGYVCGYEVHDMVEPTAVDKFALDRVQMDWNTSVDLERSGWYAFFLSRIEDPDVRIPDLSVSGIQYLDPDTGAPIDGAAVQPGETVRIQVDVRNVASSSGVIATLRLDSDNDPGNGVIFDSHTATPSDDVPQFCPWGDSYFQWTWTVPAGASLGQYYVDVSFCDPNYVLHFKDAGWQEAFTVETPVTPELTLLDARLSVANARDGQTISVDYEIASGVATSVALECVLLGSDGIAVRDAAHAISVDVAAGTGWYSRQFAINLPPGAAAGTYDVTWTLDVEGPDVSRTSVARLVVDPPIAIEIPVLAYHNVASTSPDYFTTSTADFLAQMRALKAYGYTTVSTQDVLDYRAGIKMPPEKPVLLTFDDGHESLLTIVLPILADPAIDFQATAFICTSGVRPEEDSGGYPTALLSWPQIRDLAASGRIGIQSHTINHVDLTTLDAGALAAELSGAKLILEQQLGAGAEVTSVAYPYGVCDAQVKMAAWEAGYLSAFQVYADGVELNCADKFALERAQMNWNTSVDLARSGWYEFFISRLGNRDIQMPNLSITSIRYLDPLTKRPVLTSQVRPGQELLIEVNVNNAAAPAGVIATLKIDSDSNLDNGTVFDSHAAAPTQDISVSCPWGASSFEWTWTVPSTATRGQYYVDVSFHDPLYVLDFKDTGWQRAFYVVRNTYGDGAQGSPSALRYTASSGTATPDLAAELYARQTHPRQQYAAKNGVAAETSAWSIGISETDALVQESRPLCRAAVQARRSDQTSPSLSSAYDAVLASLT